MKFWIIIFCALSSFTLQAANDGNDVVVVYNTAMAESKGVAEHYISMRGVPKSQVVGFALPRNEVMSRAQFREQLQDPLRKFLEDQQLFTFKNSKLIDAKVRYIVLCYGVPLRIESDSTVSEKVDPKLKPEQRNNGAAVDSELALLPVDKKLPLAGPLPNPVYHTTNAVTINPTNGVIMVARVDGPTPEIAMSLVDKAVQAERDGLWGRAYVDTRGLTNGPLAEAETNFLTFAQAAERSGFETTIDRSFNPFPASFPMSHIALYAGWGGEDVSGVFARPHVEFMPGAFAYALQSYDAATLRSTNTHWAGPFLAEGVTATMGAVDEPYLNALPDMAVFSTRWLLLHMTYGEAAYSALPTVSWQDVVIGDPLYNPFRKEAQKLHEELAKRGSKLVEWSHLKVVDVNAALGTPIGDLVQYLHDEPTTKTSAILSEKLGDLYGARRKPELALDEYRQALKLNPSRQQEVGLRLQIMNKLVQLGRQKDLPAEFEEFRKHCPDFPDMDGLEQKVKSAVAAAASKH